MTAAIPFFGFEVYQSELAVRKVITRVRGGYLNRWLIRAEVWAPCAFFVGAKKMYIHPLLYKQLQEQLK